MFDFIKKIFGKGQSKLEKPKDTSATVSVEPIRQLDYVPVGKEKHERLAFLARVAKRRRQNEIASASRKANWGKN